MIHKEQTLEALANLWRTKLHDHALSVTDFLFSIIPMSYLIQVPRSHVLCNEHPEELARDPFITKREENGDEEVSEIFTLS